ncbi:MAG: guanine nucleotide-binding protein (G protein) subunit beta [Amphiamblys sp. WSBS2006]|nr:MAG: guanine nucleotide-binding protein (G protein) subunit beta [Amphiamblys sp. WSBS2006]
MAKYEESTTGRRLAFREILAGHKGWVTSIAADPRKDSKTFVTCSRDKSVVVWSATETGGWFKKKSLTQNKGIVEEVAIAPDCSFIAIASWDKTVTLWSPDTNETKTLEGHTQDVTTVSVSADSSTIASGSRDGTIRVWNKDGSCVRVLDEAAKCHGGWVSSVRFAEIAFASSRKTLLISGGWDNVVKIWNIFAEAPLEFDHFGHMLQINTVAVSPDNSLCASADKSGKILLWDLVNGKYLFTAECEEPVNAGVFSPIQHWFCAASASAITVWDIETKSIVEKICTQAVAEELVKSECKAIAWSADGTTLFGGYTNGAVCVWEVVGDSHGRG